jgi:hypothetical protein
MHEVNETLATQRSLQNPELSMDLGEFGFGTPQARLQGEPGPLEAEVA